MYYMCAHALFFRAQSGETLCKARKVKTRKNKRESSTREREIKNMYKAIKIIRNIILLYSELK